MKRSLLILVLGLALCGCDGHARSFRPLSTAQRAGVDGAGEGQKLVELLTSVAARRGYTPDEPELNSGAYTVIVSFSKSVGRGSASMRLLRDTKTGRYEVALIDWPSPVRSPESVAAEAAIRGRLDEH